MATTVQYTASLCTRKTNYASNAKSGAACQEYYDPSYNYVGILCFPGMNLAGKVITGIWLSVTSAKAGYGASHTKTVYLRKALYQNSIASGVTGYGYVGDALGTFSGSFWGNSGSYAMSGGLLTNMAAYIAQGNNAFTIYNPSPVQSSYGYSTNYLQWTSVVLTVTYEESVSNPTFSNSQVDLGQPVTIYTNRQSSAATHTLSYSFGETGGTIAANVGDSAVWTPPLSLAEQIPSATSGTCAVICTTYYGGTAVGSRVNYLTLSVPTSVVPVISSVSLTEATENIAAQFGGFVRAKSRLAVSISASGAQGSTVTGYRTTIEGTAYTQASFTSNTLNTAGDQDISVTVTDSRGRTATASQTISVLDWRPPALTRFTAERCNADGSAPQTDGDRVRITAAASVSPVGSKNTMSCKVYYKLSAYTAWTQAAALTPVDYAVNAVNLLLPPTFNALNSYDLKIEVSDFFGTISQQVSIGTKKVMMDFYRDGTGVAFGKVAETSGRVEFAWPVKLSSPLPLTDGGTGANSGALACYNLGAVRKSGDTMTGNLNIQGSLYPSLKLLPTYNGTTNNTVFEGSYIGASSFSSWEDFSGNNRRMLEVRTKKYASALDNAVLLRTCDNGQWAQHRVFHAGMETPVPVVSGGTGANNASSARAALGANNAGNLNVGTLPVERLPFKYAYGTATINGVSSVYVSYSNAGFTQIPVIVATYSTTGANWSGDNGAIKVHDKTIYGCGMIVGGSFNTNRTVDWFAFGV